MDKRNKQQIILVVDDVPENIDVLRSILKDKYIVKAALNGAIALEYAESSSTPPDLILLDVMMPHMDGYEVCVQLKSKEKTKDIPVIFVSALSEVEDEMKGLKVGALDYITKPISAEIVKARVRNHLSLKRHQDHMKELVAEKTRELELTQEVTIDSLASLAEYRDPETGGHIIRTKQYVKILAQHIQHKPGYKEFLNDQTIKLLYLSAPLHDIGKVGVKDSILLKPGKLTVSEFEAMKLHTKYGRDAIMVAEKKLGSASFLRYAREIAYTHHEKWDGSGYPENLSGEDIPVIGRLMALADVYDALISKRVYKPPFRHKKAISIISEGKGKHFDPEIVDAFLELQDAFRQIAIRFADFDEEKKMLMAD